MVFLSLFVCVFICILLHIGHDLFDISFYVIFAGDLYVTVFVYDGCMGYVRLHAFSKSGKLLCLCVAVVVAAECICPVRRISTDIPAVAVSKRLYGCI